MEKNEGGGLVGDANGYSQLAAIKEGFNEITSGGYIAEAEGLNKILVAVDDIVGIAEGLSPEGAGIIGPVEGYQLLRDIVVLIIYHPPGNDSKTRVGTNP